MEFSNIWPYLEQSYSNKYNSLMTYGPSTAIWTHMVTLLEKNMTTQSNFRVIFFVCVFVFKRETVSDFGSLSQTPANL